MIPRETRKHKSLTKVTTMKKVHKHTTLGHDLPAGPKVLAHRGTHDFWAFLCFLCIIVGLLPYSIKAPWSACCHGLVLYNYTWMFPARASLRDSTRDAFVPRAVRAVSPVCHSTITHLIHFFVYRFQTQVWFASCWPALCSRCSKSCHCPSSSLSLCSRLTCFLSD